MKTKPKNEAKRTRRTSPQSPFLDEKPTFPSIKPVEITLYEPIACQRGFD